MDQELKNIWKEHLSSEKLAQLESDLADLKKISAPLNLKAKIINQEPGSLSLGYSLIPLSAVCLLLLVLFNTRQQDSYQISLQTPTSAIEAQELDSVLNFYLEDDNFNLTLSELSILEEEQ